MRALIERLVTRITCKHTNIKRYRWGGQINREGGAVGKCVDCGKRIYQMNWRK